ncbi:hypothetical protein [Maritalea sp.]|uniref:hypothetical protein n=1 Tax=Maritalea sp. TaxID=2003361 RepID=UPI003EF90E0C
MPWFKSKATLLAACLCAVLPIQSGWAQSTVPLGDGSHFIIEEYLIETNNDTGELTLLVRGKPDFQPELFGSIPADFFARTFEPLCKNLVQNSWEQLDEKKIRKTRIRWDFTPATRPEGLGEDVKWTRFHEVDFAIGEDKTCTPKPLSVAQNNLSPKMPSGLGVALRYVEQGDEWGELQLVYALDEPEQLRNVPLIRSAAMELCLIHADGILEQRFKYYTQLETVSVAVQFEQKNNERVSIERFIFPVVNQKCEAGLSDVLKSYILETAGAKN